MRTVLGLLLVIGLFYVLVVHNDGALFTDLSHRVGGYMSAAFSRATQ